MTKNLTDIEKNIYRNMIKDILVKSDLSVRKASHICGVDHQNFVNLLAGNSAVSLGRLKSYARILKCLFHETDILYLSYCHYYDLNNLDLLRVKEKGIEADINFVSLQLRAKYSDIPSAVAFRYAAHLHPVLFCSYESDGIRFIDPDYEFVLNNVYKSVVISDAVYLQNPDLSLRFFMIAFSRQFDEVYDEYGFRVFKKEGGVIIPDNTKKLNSWLESRKTTREKSLQNQ